MFQLQKLLRLPRYAKTARLRSDEWFQKICESYIAPPVYFNGAQELPGFPSDTVQLNTTGQAGIGTLTEAGVFYEDCITVFKDLGAPLKPEHNLLDFGSCWGRISRFFLRELPLENIYGIDVMKEYVDIARDTFRSDNFSVCDPFPPTSFPQGKFNFIVGYSVFSHLSEEACRCWMKEFHRILAPGGIVALTTRSRNFFDQCEAMKKQKHEPGSYPEGLSRMFDDFADAKARYDNGEFVHSNADGITGGGAMNANFYGETFIPESYAKTAYADMFVLERFLFDPSRQAHPIMFFRKK